MSTQSSKRPRQQDDDVDYVDSVHTQRIKTLNEGSDEVMLPRIEHATANIESFYRK